MSRALGIFLVGVATILATACTGNSSDPTDPRVSTIPWNPPEKWEGQGPLGSALPGQSR
jgi:hypothetical protein